MPVETPGQVRRSFETSAVRRIKPPKGAVKSGKSKRRQSTNYWPQGQLDYAFLERCKEVVCRVPHPTAHYKYQKTEYRLSVMHWSRGAYLDIRQYKNDHPSPTGILLHLDVIGAMLPDLIAAVRRLQSEDTRDEEQKAKIEVIPA